MRPFPILSFLLLALLLMLVSGCDLERTLQMAQQASQVAHAQLAKAEQAAQVAETAVKAAREIADATGSEQARSAVAIAERALLETQAAVPALRQAVADADVALSQAKEAAAAGEGVWSVVAVLASALVPAVGTAIQQWRTARKYRTATQLAVDHGRRMAAAENDSDAARVVDVSRATQEAAGVRSLITQFLPTHRG